ncbi:MAG TPA: aminopeptidase N [Natronosporangium sp.]|nr:aminopeptidase N [Natronosporangium sp.]
MPTLTMQEAAERSALVTVDRYDLDVDLTGGDETFTSTTTVRFTVAAPHAQTFVEVRPARLRRARLNGVDLDPATLDGGRLPLPGLAAGAHELVVEAEFAYSRASEGMHRFVDPADGEVYVYAQPSIAQAPAFMACFDQPDLKAPVSLRVSADPRWRVAANGEGKQVADGRWEFAPTPPLPTYLITLVAGPYHERTFEHDGIPLALLARASLAADLDRDAAELFEVTAACLDRYHELFGIRYPFGAYRQAFVPEFSWGAMEFPGCVLIRDELVFRSAVTDTEREARAALIAHEMAHMWFGDLVTMRWWDDLWLNESFADYLGWRVLAEATRWRDAWATYSVGRKAWGYAADQRPSTHPVAAAHVPDTAAALTNFDGISYAKGSAVLRQLVAWVGDEAFRAGLRRYFHDHAYGNATLSDLLSCLSESSGRDLSAWARVWLREPQVNTLRPRVRTTAVGGGDRYAEVEVVQEAPPGHPTLRPHRVTVGLYDRRGESVVRRRSVPLEVAGATTPVPELTGEPAADLLVVNDADLTYAKVRVHGRADLAELLPRLSDPLARAVVWTSAWDACRDAELPPDGFVALAAAALPTETRVPVFETVLGLATEVADRFLPPQARPDAYRRLREACRRVLGAAPPAGERQLAAARGLVACAGAADAAWLSAWLEGRDVPDGLVVDADLRWAVLYRLAVHGAVDPDRLDAEQRRDPTARGVVEATRCRAALPDEAAKQRAWRIVTTDRELSNRVVVAAAEGFWQPEQAGLTGAYVPRYFAEIGEGARWRTDQLLAAVARAAYPVYAVDAATVRAAEAFLARDDLHPGLRRVVVDATDDLRRALAARRTGSVR